MRRRTRISIGAVLVVAGVYAMASILVLHALEVTAFKAAAGALLGVGAVAGGILLMRRRWSTYDPNRGGRR